MLIALSIVQEVNEGWHIKRILIFDSEIMNF